MQVITFPGDTAGLEALISQVNQYAWVFQAGMFLLLLVAAAEAAWVFIDSSQKRKADKALAPRILSLVGVFFILPAFIFRFTGTADGVRLAVQLTAEAGGPVNYPNAIPWNVRWLIAGYGPKIALLALIGVGMSTLAAIIYASTVSRQRPSTEFVSALNNQFGELRQEIQSVKARSAAPTSAPTVSPTMSTGASTMGSGPRSAATIIDRPSASAATIIDRPGAGMAELRAVSGGSAGRSWKLPAGDATIGRGGSSLVALDDAKASREHARIRFADGVYTIQDLGSSNGTFVNERQVSGQTPLADGDLVRVGDTTLSFKSTGA